MTSWHESAFNVTGFLLGESPSSHWIIIKIPTMRSFKLGQAVEQAVSSGVAGDLTYKIDTNN